jgi:hypothetical protein
MRFGLGLKPSTPAKIAHRVKADHHGEIQARLLNAPSDFRQLTPCQRMDQGQTSTCHAHSLAAVLWTARNAMGKPIVIPSPRMIASCTYADVRAALTPAGGGLAPLSDDGAELQDDATAVAGWGIAPIKAPTSDGRFSDVENTSSTAAFPEPAAEDLEQGASSLLAGEYAITVDSTAPRVVAASIDAGIPVWVGFSVDDAFEALGSNDVAQPPGSSLGGHAVYLSGYRTNASGFYEYRLENSWGSGWADSGAVWCSTGWLLACWDLWPCTVSA